MPQITNGKKNFHQAILASNEYYLLIVNKMPLRVTTTLTMNIREFLALAMSLFKQLGSVAEWNNAVLADSLGHRFTAVRDFLKSKISTIVLNLFRCGTSFVGNKIVFDLVHSAMFPIFPKWVMSTTGGK